MLGETCMVQCKISHIFKKCFYRRFHQWSNLFIQKKLPAATWAPTKTIRNQPCNEKNPGFLGYRGDYILQRLNIGINFINHYFQDPLWKKQRSISTNLGIIGGVFLGGAQRHRSRHGAVAWYLHLWREGAVQPTAPSHAAWRARATGPRFRRPRPRKRARATQWYLESLSRSSGESFVTRENTTNLGSLRKMWKYLGTKMEQIYVLLFFVFFAGWKKDGVLSGVFVGEGWDFFGGGRDSEWGGSSFSWRFLFVGCLVCSETVANIFSIII